MTEFDISDVRLCGDGLALRPWNPDSDHDVAAWLSGTTDPEFTRWNTPDRTLTTNSEARESLRRRRDGQSHGASVSFCITDATFEAVLGHVGINAITWSMKRAHVGFWLLPEARGHHVSARALSLASAWALNDLGLYRLELYHAVGNDASCRTADLCRFTHEGTLRGRMFLPGDRARFRDAHLHARLASDPQPTATS